MKAYLRLSILALTSASLFACVSSSDDSGDDSTTGSSTNTSGATSTTTGSGGAASSSTTTDDSSTSTTGSGGSGGGVDCTTPVVMTTPLIADFEDYDGATAGVDWTWSFNEDGLGFAGFWEHTDEDPVADYTLNFIAGANDSTYAISGQDPEADEWGGGIAMYTSCLDASAYTGIQFMVKGSTPAGTFDVSITTEGDQSFSSGAVDMSEDWTQIQVAFADMEPGEDNTVSSTTGTGIGAIVFSAHLIWMQDPNATDGSWIPEPGAFEVTVDDLSFY